jgi:hypothetical protein
LNSFQLTGPGVLCSTVSSQQTRAGCPSDFWDKTSLFAYVIICFLTAFLWSVGQIFVDNRFFKIAINSPLDILYITRLPSRLYLLAVSVLYSDHFLTFG